MNNNPNNLGEHSNPLVQASELHNTAVLPAVPMKRAWYKNKILWIVAALILFAGGGTAGYVYYSSTTGQTGTNITANTSTPSVTPVPTATLKTFASTNIGVAFDYPSSWTVAPNEAATDFFPKENNDRLVVRSPDGFTLFFNTLAPSGLGGSGPCDRTITNFVVNGETKIKGAHVVSYVGDGDFVLQVSKEPTAASAQKDCLRYNSVIEVAEPTMEKDENGLNIATTHPYAIEFGTYILGETVVSTEKPNENVLKEATAILMSLRRV